MLNAEGLGLLGLVIGQAEMLVPFIKTGDCRAIAIHVNTWLPPDLRITATDVYQTIKHRPDFGGPKMNSEMLRARVDAMPVLYSARISGDIQAIANELNMLPEFAERPVSIEDARSAMAVRAVAKPTRVAAGGATMVGRSKVG